MPKPLKSFVGPSSSDGGADNTNTPGGPSEEFKVFWGDELDPGWFVRRRYPSPFLIIICLLTGLTFYLTVRLLFAPGEFQELMSAAKTEDSVLETTPKKLVAPTAIP